MITISLEDRKKIEKFIEIRNRGLYANDGEVVEVLNRLLNRRERPSSCSSCCRRHIQMLEEALKAYDAAQAKQALEAQKKQDVDNSPIEENKASGEVENKSVKKAGRPPKKK